MGGNPEGHVTLFQESGQFDQLLGLLGGSMEKTSRQERQVDALKTAKTLGLLGMGLQVISQWCKQAARHQAVFFCFIGFELAGACPWRPFVTQEEWSECVAARVQHLYA